MDDVLPDALRIYDRPSISNATMVLALGGWMDGGDVSTGTVHRLIEQTQASVVAEIDPDAYFIYQMPGSMEVASLFRPNVVIEDGLLESIDMPEACFYADEPRSLLFFMGKEPHLGWPSFGDCVFALASLLQVTRMIFVGSYAGAVPHTRQPRLYASVNDAALRKTLVGYGVRPTSYDGPGGFSTYLLSRAADEQIAMASIVAEIPAYIQGRNPLSIEVVSRRLGSILGLPTDLNELRTASDQWEAQVSEAVEKDPELADKIRQLEAAYDEDLLEQEQAGD